MSSCAIWPSVQYGHHCNMVTTAIWSPMQSGHQCKMATCSIWPPVQCDYLGIFATSAARPPVQYGRASVLRSACHAELRWRPTTSSATAAVWPLGQRACRTHPKPAPKHRCVALSRRRRRHVYRAGTGVPVRKMTAAERRSVRVPARPAPRNGHAVGDAEIEPM